jgi:uncharacterized protein YyaL (SSP411 family)
VANRLASESSPYLLLHAENPVDWYPWGEEAFERARREDRPIFLSVGYSTCYWCHVMERESFSNPDIARQMNEGFVCIKVDREERPDVDEIYMVATQLITRSGGWPNSVFLTPDLKPFFAGTYFPPRDGLGRPGFPQVLRGVREAWLLQRPELLQQADAVAEAMQASLGGATDTVRALPGPEAASQLQSALAAGFDPDRGGFGPAPKFPSPSNLDFLLDRSNDPDARHMLVVTLDHMARGGIMDHLAGGFHRYSTDADWLVPHFEKMLYDNAALARLYAEAAPLAPERGFDRVARFTLDFVLREMTSLEGGFLSAIDAETDGHEGAYYTWTADDLDAVLTGEDGALFRAVYGLEGPPTFEGDRYVVHLPRPLAEQAERLGLEEEELRVRLDAPRRALLAAREHRPRPLVDDKILTDWNGLMIGALASAGWLLGESRYVDAARRGARFVLGHLRDSDGSGFLLHTFREGRAGVEAFLDDYAFLVEGLLVLEQVTDEEEWAMEADGLLREQEKRLGDPEGGGYFASGEDPRLLFRARPAFDGAVASGNGVAALNLLARAEATEEESWTERARAAIRGFADGIARAPQAHVTLIRALSRLHDRAVAAPVAARPPASVASPNEALEDEAREVVEIQGRLGRGVDEGWKTFEVELAVRPGFHVHANPAADAALVATAVSGVLGPVRNVRYPPAESGPGGLTMYTARVTIEGEVEHRGGGAAAVEVTYQACDDQRCLPPVSRLVRLA